MTEGVITACAPRRKRKRRAAVSASTQGNTVVTMQLELVSQPAANDPMDQLPFAQSYNRLYMGARREVASQRNLDYINPVHLIPEQTRRPESGSFASFQQWLEQISRAGWIHHPSARLLVERVRKRLQANNQAIRDTILHNAFASAPDNPGAPCAAEAGPSTTHQPSMTGSDLEDPHNFVPDYLHDHVRLYRESTVEWLQTEEDDYVEPNPSEDTIIH